DYWFEVRAAMIPSALSKRAFSLRQWDAGRRSSAHASAAARPLFDPLRVKPFPRKLFRFVQTPVVVLIGDLGIVRDRRGTALVDEGERTTLAFEIILVPIEDFRELRRFGRSIIFYSFFRIHISLR